MVQKQLSDWISTKGDEELFKDKIYVGDIELTEQTNSITVHVKANKEGNQFELALITLEKIE